MKSHYYKRVLLVEDNINDIELILTTLKKHNVVNEVIVATDGEEALEYLFRQGKFAMRTKGNPIVVLLDLKLPAMDGLEVLRQIRNDDKLKTIPVVMLTATVEEEIVNESYNAGANSYVTKPVEFKEFIDIIKDIGIFWAIVNEPPLQSG